MLRDYLNIIGVLYATDFKTADVLTRLLGGVTSYKCDYKKYLQSVFFLFYNSFFSFFLGGQEIVKNLKIVQIFKKKKVFRCSKKIFLKHIKLVCNF